MKKDVKKSAVLYFGLYTAVCCIALFVIFFHFIEERKSFIWVPDSASQHFSAFVYYGKYLREIARNLFAGRLVIPQYNFSIGFGEDILTTLHYYVIGDPLNLISVVIPSKYAPYAYTLLMVLRYYLAGLAFTVLAKYKKIPAFAAVSGSVIYTFTVYSLYMAIRHPSFLNAFIYFPLVILGVEMIFDKKRPYLFILSVCLSAFSSFYFFYVISLFTVLYIFVRLFFQYDKKNFAKGFFNALGRFGGSYILGVLMAGVVFIPVVFSFLTSSRGSVEYGLNLFFDKEYYMNFIAAFTGNANLCAKGYMGYTALALAGVVMMFSSFGRKYADDSEKRQSAFLKTAFIILTVMMLFPVFSKITNGFSYVVNRWSFVYGLLAAYVFAFEIKDLKNISVKKSAVLCAAAAFFCVYIRLTISERNHYITAVTVILTVFSALCLIYSVIRENKGNLKTAGIFFKTAVLVLSVVSVFFNAEFNLFSDKSELKSSMLSINEAVKFSYSNAFKVMQKYQNTDNAVERYEEIGGELGNINNSLLNDTYSTQEYYSMANARVNEFQKDMGLVYENFSVISPSNGDPFINAAENVKYLVSSRADNTFYGVDANPLESFNKNISGAEKSVYENKNYLPFGFTYDNVIGTDDYNNLSSTEKRAMLVNAVVLNDNDNFVNSEASDFKADDILPECSITADDRAVVEKNKITVNEDGALITVRANNVPNGEIYCVFDNLKYSSSERFVANSWFVTKCNNRTTKFNFATPYNDYYSGISNYTQHFGYCTSGSAEATFNLRPGVYTFDSIHFAVQSLDGFDENVSALKEDTLQNLKIEADKISGEISLDKNKILYFSVPYSENWIAYVDGNETEVLRANTAFTALSLDKGSHTVELRYRNKSIDKSAVISLLGFAAFGAVVLVTERKIKKQADNI